MSEEKKEACKIDAKGMAFRELNALVRNHLSHGTAALELTGVNGQRYIGAGLQYKVRIDIYGTPGNDLAFAMDGPEIHVFGNAQGEVGNTMNSGKVFIHGNDGASGDARDVLGYGMRGGKIFVKGNVGYRAGIYI